MAAKKPTNSDSRELLLFQTRQVFKSIQQYRNAATAITRALARNGKKKGLRVSSYLFDGLEVEFVPGIKEEIVFLDYVNSRIVLRVPKMKNESPKKLRERRMDFLGYLIREAEAVKAIGIGAIFEMLSPEGQRQLLRDGQVAQSQKNKLRKQV